jgi:hypothetical protein
VAGALFEIFKAYQDSCVKKRVFYDFLALILSATLPLRRSIMFIDTELQDQELPTSENLVGEDCASATFRSSGAAKTL